MTQIKYTAIPPAEKSTGSMYDPFLKAALSATGGKGVEVPITSSKGSTVSGLGRLIRHRKLPLRIIQRKGQVFVARREEGR